MPNSELGRVPSLLEPIAKRREREGTTFDTSHALAQAIMKGWKKGSPADSLVISPEFELMGRQPVNELLFRGNTLERYLMFLQESLTGKLPGLVDDTSRPEPINSDPVLRNLYVVLNNTRSSEEVLGVFQTPESGHQDYTVVNIDTTAFENGGMLTIEVSVGHAEAAGSFDLFDGDSELPTRGAPENALAQRGVFHRVEHENRPIFLSSGQHFKLGATGDWFSKKGSINGFLVKISVDPEMEEVNDH